MLKTLLLLLTLFAVAAEASLYLAVDPRRTDAQIQKINGDHTVLTPHGKSNGLLLITLGGTNSTPDELLAFQQTGAAQGYHVIGIDYPNRVITTICRNQTDRECFNKFRDEVVSGAPVSPLTEVNAANCILNRVQKLLQHLTHEAWPGRWSQFLDELGNLNWRRTVLAGHSQGSGHAAYLAQIFGVQGVILIAGPQDVSAAGPASWLVRAGHTPGDHYYALLHEKDPFGADWQVEAVRRLSGGSAQIILSKTEVDNPHMALITRAFEQSWALLLRLPYLKKENLWRMR